MAYKNIQNYFFLADIAIEKNTDNNRSLLFFCKIDNSIDWEPVEHLIIKFYETKKSKEGERAYSPLVFI